MHRAESVYFLRQHTVDWFVCNVQGWLACIIEAFDLDRVVSVIMHKAQIELMIVTSAKVVWSVKVTCRVYNEDRGTACLKGNRSEKKEEPKL